MKTETAYRLAIIISCFNRKQLSVRCVNSLLEAVHRVPGLTCDFIVWDDGSTDGTADALEEISDCVKVFRGPGDYYWAKSMHAAMTEAKKGDYDLYMMVNDDVKFFPDSVHIMMDSYRRAGGNCAIVGSSVCDGISTYGGLDRKYNLISPAGELVKCVYSDWNCFLIDREVINRVGVIDGRYAHAFGDWDYSSRMNRMKLPIYIAFDYVGECRMDHPEPAYFDKSRSLRERFKQLASPKGMPIGSFFRFHWVDKRIKGIIIAICSYAAILIKMVF